MSDILLPSLPTPFTPPFPPIQTGVVWKHPNLGMAYVAQHAFHHVEQHLEKSPNEYIRWRFARGEDREELHKVGGEQSVDRRVSGEWVDWWVGNGRWGNGTGRRCTRWMSNRGVGG